MFKGCIKLMNKKIQAKPFLKWAGGKTQLLSEIASKFPYKNMDEFSYVEPFVGSGAVLFWVLNNFPRLQSVVINDMNTDLINTYKTVKINVTDLISILKKIEKEYHDLSNKIEQKKVYYYNKRVLFNTRESDVVEQAALFIFLNRACFNGLYRVNRKNEFNVPIGSYKTPMICDSNNLMLASKFLQSVEILCGDFKATADFITKNSVFYFDPPYKPLSETSSFNSYTKDEFDDDEQVRLKKFCDKLDAQNCKWLLSNSDVKGNGSNNNFFDDLFGRYQIDRVVAKRSINANPNKRGKLTELLIAN